MSITEFYIMEKRKKYKISPNKTIANITIANPDELSVLTTPTSQSDSGAAAAVVLSGCTRSSTLKLRRWRTGAARSSGYTINEKPAFALQLP